MSHNRRKHRRIPVTLQLNIIHLNGDVIGIGGTLNISEGGCCILCQQELSPGHSYRLEFEHPGEPLLSVLAKVVYQDPDSGIFKTGFEFETHEGVKEWISKL